MLLTLLACKAVDPAPTELDALLHWFWQRYDDTEEAPLAEALVNLDATVKGSSIEGPTDGTIDRMSAEEAALVGVDDRDPQDAVGLYLLNAFPCDWESLKDVLSDPDQDILYPDLYDHYDRTFDGGASRGDFVSGELARIDYDISYGATVLGASYEVSSRGAMRTIAAIDEEQSPFGEFLVQRSYMPKPAVYEEGSNKSFDQDYQIEIYWRTGDHIAHAYGLWRQADYGSGINSESTSAQRLLLNGLIDWDETTASHCGTGER